MASIGEFLAPGREVAAYLLSRIEDVITHFGPGGGEILPFHFGENPPVLIRRAPQPLGPARPADISLNGSVRASWVEAGRHCQTNLSRLAKGASLKRSGRQLTPLGHCGSAVLLEDFTAIEVAV